VAGAVAFSPDGKILATAGTIASKPGEFRPTPFPPDPDRIRLWDTSTWQPIGHVGLRPGEDALVRSLSFSSDGRYLAGLCDDDKVRIWDAKSLALTVSVNDGGKGGGSAVFSPDGSHLAIVRNYSVNVVRIDK